MSTGTKCRMYISLNGLDWQREVRGTRPRTDEISRHAEIESKGCSDNHANYMTPHEVEGKKIELTSMSKCTQTKSLAKQKEVPLSSEESEESVSSWLEDDAPVETGSTVRWFKMGSERNNSNSVMLFAFRIAAGTSKLAEDMFVLESSLASLLRKVGGLMKLLESSWIDCIRRARGLPRFGRYSS